MQGAWGAPTAPLDWCERNYNWTYWMAEPFNTLSSVAYAVVALLLWRRARTLHATQPVHLVTCAALVATAVFSGAFHASLRLGMQKADESAETWTLLSLAYAATWPSTRRRSAAAAAHAVAAAIGIFAIPIVFCEVHLFAVVLFLLWTLHTASKQQPALTEFTRRGAVAGAAAFAVWAVDLAACDLLYRTLPVHPHLHAWWHIGTAYALHQAGSAVLLLDVSRDRKKR